MAKSTLPADMLDFLANVLPRNKALFGDLRMEDNGGAGSGGGAGDGSGSGGAGDGSGGQGGSGSGGSNDGVNDRGYPDNTPVEQMTPGQQVNYWKHQARKHEDRVKSYGGHTPEQLAEFKDKAAKHDQAEREAASDKDKAVAEAKEQAEKDTKSALVPKLVRAEFKAALTGRVKAEELEDRITAITEPLDLSKFLNAAGDVDTDKVTTFVDSIAPVTGTGQNGRKGPTATGHGSGTGTSEGAPSGRELFEARRGKKSTSAA